MKKVFLGGTVNGINPLYGWRGQLIPKLQIEYFNPVVKKYDNVARKEEIKQKKECDYNLFVITPDIRGYFSIFEAADLSNKCPEKVIFCILNNTFENDKKFSKPQIRLLKQIGNEIKRNGGYFVNSLEEVIAILNNQEQQPYIYRYRNKKLKFYNPNYGDERICKCGHSYDRHFDNYENNYPCGCKYCSCDNFEEKKK